MAGAGGFPSSYLDGSTYFSGENKGGGNVRRLTHWQLTACVLISICAAHPLPAQQRERDTSRGNQTVVGRNRVQSGQAQERQRDRDRDAGDRSSQSTQPRFAPPRPDRPRQWYLGVAVDYRDFGAQVTQVQRRSPAQRAGIEIRDVIVTVNGYQVGRVNGRQYPLDRELELRADRRGQVTLLVQNHRNGQLLPVSVRLEPAERRRDPLESELIIGTVSARRANSLASGAVLRIRLLDVTDRRLPARTVAQRMYQDLGPWPIPFELKYDRGDIDAKRQYALEAEVTVNGFAALRTAERVPVLATGRQGRVDLVVEPVRR